MPFEKKKTLSFLMIVAYLAVTFAGGFIAVGVVSFSLRTMARTTHRISPPACRTRLIHAVFAVLSWNINYLLLSSSQLRRAGFL